MSTSTSLSCLISLLSEHFIKLPRVSVLGWVWFQWDWLLWLRTSETNKLITILDNRCQTSYTSYFLKYPLKARQRQFITMDMPGFIPPARRLFQTQNVLGSFPISLKHLKSSSFKDKNCNYEPPIRVTTLSSLWKITGDSFQKDSWASLSPQTLAPHMKSLVKTLDFSELLTNIHLISSYFSLSEKQSRWKPKDRIIGSKINHYFQNCLRTFLRHSWATSKTY